MTQRRHITLVSAGATMLAAMPLAVVFAQWTWLVGVLIVVLGMTAAAFGLRSVRAPGWTPTAGMIGAYVLTLTWLYADGKALLAVIPTPSTVIKFNDLLVRAGVAIRENGVPVEDDPGLLFLAALGIGAVHLAIDLAAVVARRPAIAGVPMAAIYLVAVGTHTESVSFLPFVCTAAAFLWLLATDNVDRVRRFGRRFTGDGRDVDVWEPSPLAAAGRRLAVVGVVLAVLLPIAVPGMTTGLLDRFGSGVGTGNGPGNGPGRAGTVNLWSLLSGSLVRDRTYDMVKVTTSDPNPFYLRIGVAELLTSNGFINRPNWGPGQPLSNVAAPQSVSGPGVASRNHRADVEILTFDEQILPFYQHPTKFDRLDNAWQWDRKSGVVYSTRATAKKRKYSFNYTRQEFSPEALRSSPPLPREDQQQQDFTKLPNSPIPKITERAGELTRGKTTPYDKVRAIYDYFSPANNFRYSLNTVSGNSGSVLVDFLNNKVGYCEQYAAAMAWLVRAAGIPARVAFGFTKGSNKNGNTYTLNNFNLHAWTEVFFQGFGWVPFDATPPASITGSVSTPWAPDPTQPTTSNTAEGADDINAGPDASGLATAPDQDKFGPNDQGAAGGDNSGSFPRVPTYIIGGLLLVLVLLAMPGLRRAGLRRHRRPGQRAADTAIAVSGDGTDPDPDAAPAALGAYHQQARRDAHAAWDELVDTMIDFRVLVNPAETPRTTADRLVREQKLSDHAADGVQLLGRAEEQARYARAPLAGIDLAASLRAVRGALRERVSRRTRLLATFLPRSVLMRWRTMLLVRYVQAINSMGRRRDSVTRAVSPRRLIAGRSTR